jgi:hypothetical protein
MHFSSRIGLTRKAAATAAVTSGGSDHGPGVLQTDVSVLGHSTYYLDDVKHIPNLQYPDRDGGGGDAPAMLMTGTGAVDTAIAETSMKAQRRLVLALWPRITSAFLTDAAVLILASQSPRASQTVAWWVGVAVAAVVTIAFLLIHRRRFGRDVVGMYEYRGRLVDPQYEIDPRSHARQWNS